MFFGINIKYLRALKGLTQTDLAEVMKVTASAVAGWESGKSSPHFQVLLQLHDYFQVDLERLVYHDLQKGVAEGIPVHASPNTKAGSNLRLMELYEELKGRMEALENRVKKMEGK